MITGILTGLIVGAILTTIGGMFIYIAKQGRPQQALGMYGVGMFIKMTVGISSIVAVTQLTSIDPLSYTLTLGTLVCISYPLLAIMLTRK